MAALQTIGRSALRATKNYGKGYTHAQIKARNTTCNDPWPPSGKDMAELAQMSFRQTDFMDVMEVIDKRLNDKGKNWRHVFKSLVVLDYLLHAGSEKVIHYCEENLYVIKTLREFQYIDDDGQDHGANVRHKAADITNLLADRPRLQRERAARADMYGRMSQSGPSRTSGYPNAGTTPSRPLQGLQGRTAVHNEDEDLARAIEASLRSAADEQATVEDRDLARALALSREEEEKERQRREHDTSAALFDEAQRPPAQQQDLLIDASLPLQYAPTGAPQQMPPQFPTQFQLQAPLQPQFTSLQPQLTSYNPYIQTMQPDFSQLQQPQQQAAPIQPQYTAQPAQALQPLVPQHTAALRSNNPFAHSPVPPVWESPDPSSPSGGPSSTGSRSDPSALKPVTFNLTGTYEGRSPSRDRYGEGPPSSSSRERDSERDREREAERARELAFERARQLQRELEEGGDSSDDEGGAERLPGVQQPTRRPEDERLASLFAGYAGDGVDTLGNVGELRYGVQSGKIAAQRTGGTTSPANASHANTNPFLQPRPGVSENLIDI